MIQNSACIPRDSKYQRSASRRIVHHSSQFPESSVERVSSFSVHPCEVFTLAIIDEVFVRRLMLAPSRLPLCLSPTPQPNDLCLHQFRLSRPSYTELPSTVSMCRSVAMLAGGSFRTKRHYVYHWRLYYHSRDITLDSGE